MKKLILFILVSCVLAQHTDPRNQDINIHRERVEIICLNERMHCDNIEVVFRIPVIRDLMAMGLRLVETDIVIDTGTAVTFIPSLNAYWVSKEDGPSVRYDADIYEHIGCKCIKRD